MDNVEPLVRPLAVRHGEKLAAISKSHPASPDDRASPVDAATAWSVAVRWLWHDLPYVTMLLLALIGIVFRLPFTYWVVLTPVFGVISIATGWHHFVTREARLELVYRLILSWCALLLAIYLLFSGGVQGVLNSNANSLAMLTLLALGTFITGVEAREWRICVVGGVLFLAVPGLGWLDQSPLLLAAATVVIIGFGGFAWWINHGRAVKETAP